MPVVEIQLEKLFNLLGLQLYEEPSIFIRELIQNSYDAGAENIRIDINKKAKEIIFYNDGKSFDKEDILRIHNVASGGKKQEEAGTFGIGFRSVYYVSEKPIIESGNFRLEFNGYLNYEIKLINSLQKIDNSLKIQEIIDEYGNLMFESTKKGTKIILPIKNVFLDELESFIEKLPESISNMVIFLDRIIENNILSWITNIDIYIDNEIFEKISIQRNKNYRGSKFIELIININKKKKKIKKLIYSKRDVLITPAYDPTLDKKYKVSISVAYPIKEDNQLYQQLNYNGLVYSYLPTRIPSGEFFDIHSKFKTTASRDSITAVKTNGFLLEQMGDNVARSLLELKLIYPDEYIIYLSKGLSLSIPYYDNWWKSYSYLLTRKNAEIIKLIDGSFCSLGNSNLRICREKELIDILSEVRNYDFIDIDFLNKMRRDAYLAFKIQEVDIDYLLDKVIEHREIFIKDINWLAKIIKFLSKKFEDNHSEIVEKFKKYKVYEKIEIFNEKNELVNPKVKKLFFPLQIEKFTEFLMIDEMKEYIVNSKLIQDKKCLILLNHFGVEEIKKEDWIKKLISKFKSMSNKNKESALIYFAQEMDVIQGSNDLTLLIRKEISLPPKDGDWRNPTELYFESENINRLINKDRIVSIEFPPDVSKMKKFYSFLGVNIQLKINDIVKSIQNFRSYKEDERREIARIILTEALKHGTNKELKDNLAKIRDIEWLEGKILKKLTFLTAKNGFIKNDINLSLMGESVSYYNLDFVYKEIEILTYLLELKDRPKLEDIEKRIESLGKKGEKIPTNILDHLLTINEIYLRKIQPDIMHLPIISVFDRGTEILVSPEKVFFQDTNHLFGNKRYRLIDDRYRAVYGFFGVKIEPNISDCINYIKEVDKEQIELNEKEISRIKNIYQWIENELLYKKYNQDFLNLLKSERIFLSIQKGNFIFKSAKEVVISKNNELKNLFAEIPILRFDNFDNLINISSIEPIENYIEFSSEKQDDENEINEPERTELLETLNVFLENIYDSIVLYYKYIYNQNILRKDLEINHVFITKSIKKKIIFSHHIIGKFEKPFVEQSVVIEKNNIYISYDSYSNKSLTVFKLDMINEIVSSKQFGNEINIGEISVLANVKKEDRIDIINNLYRSRSKIEEVPEIQLCECGNIVSPGERFCSKCLKRKRIKKPKWAEKLIGAYEEDTVGEKPLDYCDRRGIGYDFEARGRLIEVKQAESNEPIKMSYREWEEFKKAFDNKDNYYIYVVSNIETNDSVANIVKIPKDQVNNLKISWDDIIIENWEDFIEERIILNKYNNIDKLFNI